MLTAPNELWAIANASTGADSIRTQYILHSLDTGHAWTIDSTSLKGFDAVDLCFSDPGHGWIVMDSGDSSRDTMVYITRYTNQLASVANKPLDKNEVATPYPNPTERYLHLPLPAIADGIMVSDCMGRVVEVPSKIEGGTITLDLNTLVEGVYYIEMTTPSGQVYRAKATKIE